MKYTYFKFFYAFYDDETSRFECKFSQFCVFIENQFLRKIMFPSKNGSTLIFDLFNIFDKITSFLHHISNIVNY